jgi:tyrosyl-tRNA synthetase
MNPFLEDLRQRGLIHQCTDLDGLSAAMDAGPIKAYIGFDLTADSLHVGSLMQLKMIRLLQEHGHHPIVVFGDATTRIGDPTGKDAMRPMLDDATIEANRVGILEVFDRVVGSVPIFHNSEWMKTKSFMEVLRDIGPHFTINKMLTLDSVKTRLDRQEPMTFLEFNYMIMQSMDFLELSEISGVVLQIGGSDQWGNIINGVDLVRRKTGKQVFGLTTPLMTNSAGEKMGKTAQGPMWLTASKTDPFDFWQFWRNVEDSKVEFFLAQFTDLPLDAIDHGMGVNGPGINAMKKLLAFGVTELVHGIEVAQLCQDRAEKIFEQGGLDAGQEVRFAHNDLMGLTLTDLIVKTGLESSKNAARRLAEGGGFSMNDIQINTPGDWQLASITSPGQEMILRAGKKRRVKVVIV